MKRTIKLLTAAFFLMLLAGPGAGLSQSSQRQTRHENQGERRTKMMEQCRMMSGERQEMFSKMEQKDEELQSLVSEMKAVDDQAEKVQRMEQLLETMVENRIEMREQMREMMPRMMQHMSGHMRMSQESGDSSMMDCPAMGGQRQRSGEDQSTPRGRRD